MTYFLLRDYDVLPKKELHSSLWVDTPYRLLGPFGLRDVGDPAVLVRLQRLEAILQSHSARLCRLL